MSPTVGDRWLGISSGTFLNAHSRVGIEPRGGAWFHLWKFLVLEFFSYSPPSWPAAKCTESSLPQTFSTQVQKWFFLFLRFDLTQLFQLIISRVEICLLHPKRLDPFLGNNPALLVAGGHSIADHHRPLPTLDAQSQVSDLIIMSFIGLIQRPYSAINFLARI